MSIPSVTVGIPVHNAARYLDDAIASIRTQSLHAIQIVVVDDGSTDGSAAVADRNAALDERVHVVHQPHRGVAAARNRVLADATTDYVAFLDADDLAMPARLERQLSYLEAHPDVMALGTHGWRMGSAGRTVGVFDVGPKDEAHLERIKGRGEPVYLLSSSVILSRRAAVECGGFRDLPAAEDVDLWTRIADRHLVVALPERLVRYRVTADGLSSRRFAAQMYATALVAENARRRRRGEPETTLRSVVHDLENAPTLARARRRLSWFSQRCYRTAGAMLANGDPRGAAWLACAVVVQPTVPLGRLWRQVAPLLVARIARRGSG